MILKNILYSIKTSRLNLSLTKMIPLKQVVEQLEYFAPLTLAGKWDNVGLLIEPYTPKNINVIFLTNDLTEKVLFEAVDKKADLIISYHPPIFAPIKKINNDSWKGKIISICLENRIAVYSPHTTWDVARNGINDWLASMFGPHKYIIPIQPNVECSEIGMGRILHLKTNTTLENAITTVKEKLNLKHVHVGIGTNANMKSEINKIAICAGSGSSILKETEADLYLTGEMSHHDILDANQNNISVILCNHSNSERGFLPHFKSILQQLIGDKIDIVVSEVDEDPLKTY